MKVGLVLDDTLDTNDGVQQYVLMLGAWLSDHKHEVHYLVGKTKRSDLARLHSLSKNIKVRFNRNRLSIPLPVSSRKIKKLLKKEAFDVLHVQTPYSPQLGGKIIRYADARTAVIATFHILPFSATERIGSSFLAKVQRKSLRRIDMMVSVSEPARKFAHKYFGVDSVVIPNPVNIAKLSSGNHLEEFREKQLVVYLGRLVERKGILQFLRVVRKIKQTYRSPMPMSLLLALVHSKPE